MKKNHCPICHKEQDLSERYPNYVCQDCKELATDKSNRKLEFFNTSFAGGYGARYADNKEPYDSHVCYIQGKECRADEAYFGGIVVQTV